MNENYKADDILSSRRCQSKKKAEHRELNPDLSKESITQAIENQYLDKQYLQALFPSREISKRDVVEINKVLKDENSDRYSELLSLVLEHKDILNQKECPDLITYLRAMKYVGHITIGKSFYEAYVAAHSDIKDIQAMYLSDSDALKETLKKKAMLYSKSKLVMQITKALDYPLHLVYAGYRHQAIETLRREMNKAPLPRDRIQAADRLLAHLAPTLESTTNILNVNINKDGEKNILETYREAMMKFVTEKKELLESNTTIDAKEIINLGAEKDDN